MKITVPIAIETILPGKAKLKASYAEKLANGLDEDTLRFLAELVEQKGRAINESIRNNQILIANKL